MNNQPRNAPVSEALKTQSSLVNGDDKVHSLISIPATHRVGAMTDLQVTDRLLFPIPRVTGVPTAPALPCTRFRGSKTQEFGFRRLGGWRGGGQRRDLDYRWQVQTE
jgi:hypothetical protein